MVAIYLLMFEFYYQARRNRGGWGGRLQPRPPPRFLLNLTFYQLAMIVKRKKWQKTYKPLQIPRKLLVTLLLSTSGNA